ncbi:hypothetical protein [Pedobacter nototheniae]|uniref:hypothetical protein n=1 Tax=Pedobacter nototheniae TaxID=2488994 RepID=UPI00103C34CC|nr:hypothetical protein [Pedobacter nototheniae]
MSEEITTRAAFLKIGSKKNSYDLFKNGTIYCNTLHYFADLKDENNRGDFYETVDFIKNIQNVYEFQISQGGFHRKQSLGPAKVTRSINSNHSVGNLYCLYTLRFPLDTLQTGVYNLNINCDIDGYCVYIHNVKEFCLRVEKAIRDKNLRFQQGFVKYLDLEQFEVRKNFFLKDNEYCNQNEYRYLIYSDSNQSLRLSIGSIADIACISPFSEFKERKLVVYNTLK